MEKPSISMREASILLGMDRETLSYWIRSGKCPFGEYIKGEDREKGAYYINRTRLDSYIHAEDMHPIFKYATAQ